MSLHSLAQHLQSAGRGEDKVLVHMTPGEVSGLQSLAMAHGGSLTINPETGLPEAGFLSSLLPMIAGFALGPAGFGMTAMNAALTVGAVGAAATGSLGKGLMMGLGAYGGAGLGAGLSNMGATEAAQQAYAPQAAEWAKFSQNLANPASVTATGTAATGAPLNVFPDIAATNQSILQSPMLAGRMPAAESVVSSTLPTSSVLSGPVSSGISAAPSAMDKLGMGFKQATGTGLQGLKDLYAASEAAAPYSGVAGIGSLALGKYFDRSTPQPVKTHPGLIRPYTYERTQRPEAYDMGAPMYAATPGSSAERNYFTDQYIAQTPYTAPGPEYAAEGGLMGYAVGGPVEQMAAMNAVGASTGYPMAGINTSLYTNPTMQRPEAVNVLAPSSDAGVGAYSGEPKFFGGGIIKAVAEPQTTGGYSYSYDPQTMQFTQLAAPTAKPNPIKGIMNQLGSIITGKQLAAAPAPANGTVTGGIAQPAVQPAQPTQPAQPAYTPPPTPAYQTPEQQLGLESFYPMMERRLAALGAAQGYAAGGDVYNLGGYSDGGRLLKGPGDGVSDSIPAVIGNRQPARLADGEFVVPARIVSELGNGSTEAGARKLYAMMDRVQKARRKTVGKNKVAANTRSEKYLPA